MVLIRPLPDRCLGACAVVIVVCSCYTCQVAGVTRAIRVHHASVRAFKCRQWNPIQLMLMLKSAAATCAQIIQMRNVTVDFHSAAIQSISCLPWHWWLSAVIFSLSLRPRWLLVWLDLRFAGRCFVEPCSVVELTLSSIPPTWMLLFLLGVNPSEVSLIFRQMAGWRWNLCEKHQRKNLY